MLRWSAVLLALILVPIASPAAGPTAARFVTLTPFPVRAIDPASAWDASSGTVIQQTYDTLVAYDPSTRGFVPALATTVPTLANGGIPPDGLVLTFHLRDDAMFHSGAPVRAQDAAFSLQRVVLIADPNGPAAFFSPLRGASAYLASHGTQADRDAFLAAGGVEATDDATLVLRLDRADATLLATLAQPWGSVVERAVVCKHADPTSAGCIPPTGTPDAWLAAHEAGSGPFILQSLSAGDVNLAAFPAYWGGIAHSTFVDIRTVDGAYARLGALRNGTADVAYVNGHESEAASLPGVRVIESPSFVVNALGLNEAICGRTQGPVRDQCLRNDAWLVPRGVDGAPDPFFFDDVHMRRAFAIAYDAAATRQAIGHVAPIDGLLPPGFPMHDDTRVPPARDAEAAVRELAAARHPNGFTIVLAYDTGNVLRGRVLAQLQADLESLSPGIHVSVQSIDFSTAYLPLMRAHALPTVFAGWLPDLAHPDNYFGAYAESSGVFAKRIGYANATLDAALDGLRAQMDPALAAAGYADAQHALDADAPYLWLYASTDVHAERDDVRGYVHDPMAWGEPTVGHYAQVRKFPSLPDLPPLPG